MIDRVQWLVVVAGTFVDEHELDDSMDHHYAANIQTQINIHMNNIHFY